MTGSICTERQERPRTMQRKTWVSERLSWLCENGILLLNKLVSDSPLGALFAMSYQLQHLNLIGRDIGLIYAAKWDWPHCCLFALSAHIG